MMTAIMLQHTILWNVQCVQYVKSLVWGNLMAVIIVSKLPNPHLIDQQLCSPLYSANMTWD